MGKYKVKKKARLVDVAKLAGVSKSTVSFVLNDKEGVSISTDTKKRVLEAASKINYIHKSSVKNKNRTNNRNNDKTIGFMFPTYANVFHTMAAGFIDEEANERGYNVILYNTHRDETKESEQIEWLLSKGVDGIVYSFNPKSLSLIENYSKHVPIVILGEKNDAIDISTVSLNSFKAGEIIAQHLIDLGHKKIGFLTTPINKYTISRQMRLNGILATLKKYNLKENLYIEQSEEKELPYSCNYEINVGFNLTHQLISKKKVTAIIGLNDMFAIGILSALNIAGIKVPEEISVCGFDNNYISDFMNPSLTSVEHFLQYRCKTVMDILLEYPKDNMSDSIKIEYDPKIVIRKSTGPALEK